VGVWGEGLGGVCGVRMRCMGGGCKGFEWMWLGKGKERPKGVCGCDRANPKVRTHTCDTQHPLPPSQHTRALQPQVTAIFNSSLEVAVTVFGETPSEGVIFHCADACVTVVVVDKEGGPSSIPFVLDPQTPNQQLRYMVRRRLRVGFGAGVVGCCVGREALRNRT